MNYHCCVADAKYIFFNVMLSFVMPGIMLIVMKSRYNAVAYTVWFKL
jgi:hypothetical protein